jgi:hypothetical protein
MYLFSCALLRLSARIEAKLGEERMPAIEFFVLVVIGVVNAVTEDRNSAVSSFK